MPLLPCLRLWLNVSCMPTKSLALARLLGTRGAGSAWGER
eukprot:CAMPEP_0172926808 /NCGR_PEP_ID=MMETSP1075-20121228/216320_1 /TAXON_ID=2916 /ORGANISM="Ceratium fusus, Strain PA161109" /LENGTH=39 /DNA_ID= /DNA_START= /DNA_END= /DNA_ORIENTATION=